MNNIIIRLETEDDYESVFNIKHLGWLLAYSHIFSTDAINKHFESKKINHEKNKQNKQVAESKNQFVATLNGTVVATMNIAPKNQDEDFVEIMWLYVHPDYQRMGIGKKLYDFAKNFALVQNAKKIHIEALKDNHIGCSFYTKTGGKIISKKTKEMLGQSPELVTFEFEIQPVIIETERLLLRNYTETDIDDYFEYISHKDVGPRCGWEPRTEKSQALERLKLESQKPLQFAIVWKETNKVIGSIEIMNCKAERYSNLKIEDGAKEIGFLLSPAFWGKGIMPEACKAVLKLAFETLDISVIYIGHAEANIQSGKVQEKLGFNIIGKLENYRTWTDGKLTNLIERKMTKNDWLKIKNTY